MRHGAAIFTWYNLMRGLKAVGAWDEVIVGAAPFLVRESRDARNSVINTIVASDNPDERIFSISRDRARVGRERGALGVWLELDGPPRLQSTSSC